MLNLSRLCGVFLLALPCVAQADLVEVVTESSGTMRPDNAMLAVLGLQSVTGTDALPYTLTISSIFDPDGPNLFADPTANAFGSRSAQVDLAFTLGGQSYHYAGLAMAYLTGNPWGYGDTIIFNPPQSPSVHVSFSHVAYIDGYNFLQGWVLNPPTIVDAHGMNDYDEASVQAYHTYANVDGIGSMNAFATDYSMHALSPVPEPAPAAMLAAGLALMLPGALRRINVLK